MSRFIFSLFVCASLFLIGMIGCGHHHKYHHRGIAATNSSNGVVNIDSSSSIVNIDSSITNVTVNFYDPLSDAERQSLIDQIRSEVIAWELEHRQYVVDVVIDVLVSANFDIDLQVDITPDAIYIGCVDGEHLDLPPGILKKFLCKWHKMDCHDEDDDQEDE